MDEKFENAVIQLPKATRNFYVDGHKPKPHWLINYMEIENHSYFYLGVDSLCNLGLMALLKSLEPNYVTLCI